MYRFFSIETVDGAEYFIMFSKFSSEFGEVVLVTQAPLAITESNVSIHQGVQGGHPQDVSFEDRIDEMRYFLDCFSMFNPKIKKSYEEKTLQPQTPADFPF